MTLVDFSRRSGQPVQAALHGLPSFDQGVSFEMDGERDEDGDDEGFLPHAQNAGADDGQTGQHLETHLQISQRGKGFLEHLNTADGDARDSQERDEDAVVTNQFSQHDHQQDREGDTSSNQPPLVGAKSVGFGHHKVWFNAQDVAQCTVSCVEKRFLIGDHQLNENSVIIGDFGVQNTGLTADHPLEFLQGDIVSLCHGFGPYPDDFMMVNIGGMAQ